jgi:hypothetical protein
MQWGIRGAEIDPDDRPGSAPAYAPADPDTHAGTNADADSCPDSDADSGTNADADPYPHSYPDAHPPADLYAQPDSGADRYADEPRRYTRPNAHAHRPADRRCDPNAEPNAASDPSTDLTARPNPRSDSLRRVGWDWCWWVGRRRIRARSRRNATVC